MGTPYATLAQLSGSLRRARCPSPAVRAAGLRGWTRIMQAPVHPLITVEAGLPSLPLAAQKEGLRPGGGGRGLLQRQLPPRSRCSWGWPLAGTAWAGGVSLMPQSKGLFVG